MTHFEETMARAKACLSSMIRKRNPAGMAAMRSVISSLENACAVEIPVPMDEAAAHVLSPHSETARRLLSDNEVNQILANELAMRTEQFDTFT